MGMTLLLCPVDSSEFDPDAVDFISIYNNEVTLNLDKNWQGIHYLLTGDPWESESLEGKALMGGKEFGDDLGYGPARLVSEEEVKSVADCLKGVTGKSLAAKVNPDKMAQADIYAFDSEYIEEELDMLADYVDELKDFYLDAAAQSQSIVILMV